MVLKFASIFYASLVFDGNLEENFICRSGVSNSITTFTCQQTWAMSQNGRCVEGWKV